jgi:acetyl-CoA acetyltransferase
MSISGKAAIVGIGATEFSKDSGRSEVQLASEAVVKALDDAGLRADEIDGMVTYSHEDSIEIEVARAVGIPDVRFLASLGYGGGAAAGTMTHAAMAIATGQADVVVGYRSLNERSGHRFGAGNLTMAANPLTAYLSFARTFGQVTPGSWIAMFAQRYLYEYGLTTEAFGHVAVSERRYAATNPNAWFYNRPITLADHQASRWVVEPLHLLDMCQESDGGCAFIMTSVERAKDLKQKPVILRAGAQGFVEGQYYMTSYYSESIVGMPELRRIGDELERQSGIRVADVDAAMLYDHFTPYVLVQLEEFGFCKRGEAADFAASGQLDIDGQLPVNTHGGLLGEGYIHGANNINEAVRQLRGTAVNQLADPHNVLVTGGTGIPTTAVILGVD